MLHLACEQSVETRSAEVVNAVLLKRADINAKDAISIP